MTSSSVAMPPMPTIGMSHGLSHLVDAAQGDRLDGRTAQPTHHVAQQRAALSPVDGHSQQRVDQADRVRSAVGRRLGDGHDTRHVGGQLRHDRQLARGPHRRHQVAAQLRIGAEIHATRHVRAGDVQLQRVHATRLLQLQCHRHILVRLAPSNAHNHARADLTQIRQVMGDEGVNAVVVQADRVEQPGRCLDRAPGRIARPWLRRHRLGNHPTQPGQVDQMLHLPRVAERAAGHQDRIRQA